MRSKDNYHHNYNSKLSEFQIESKNLKMLIFIVRFRES